MSGSTAKKPGAGGAADNGQQFGMPRPRTVYLHLTKRCNLDCQYCYFDAGQAMADGLSLKEFTRLFGDIVQLGLEKLVFTGGEPLLREDIFDIVSIFRQIDAARRTHLCLMSNGLLIDDEVAHGIARHLNEVRLSVDGPEAVIDRLRGRGSFQ